jgi:hypothetical protein
MGSSSTSSSTQQARQHAVAAVGALIDHTTMTRPSREQLVKDEAVVGSLVTLMGCDNADMQLVALRTLKNLMTSHGLWTRGCWLIASKFLEAPGAISGLVAVLAGASRETQLAAARLEEPYFTVTKTAAWMVANLAGEVTEFAIGVASDAGAVPGLLQLLRSGGEDMATAALMVVVKKAVSRRASIAQAPGLVAGLQQVLGSIASSDIAKQNAAVCLQHLGFPHDGQVRGSTYAT